MHLELLQLLADVPITLVEDLAHRGEPGFVQEDHEQEELADHDGQGQVEVEDLSCHCMCWQRHQRVCDGCKSCWAHECGQLCFPVTRSTISQSARSVQGKPGEASAKEMPAALLRNVLINLCRKTSFQTHSGKSRNIEKEFAGRGARLASLFLSASHQGGGTIFWTPDR